MVANSLRLGKRWAWWVTVVYGLLNLAPAALAVVADLCRAASCTARRSCSAAPCSGSASIGLLVFNRGAFRVPLRRRVTGGVAATEGDSMARARALLMASAARRCRG